MKYTKEEMLQDVANGVLQDMETMLELANGEPKVRATQLPSGWKKKQDIMVKASDIGLEKVDYTKDVLTDAENVRRQIDEFVDRRLKDDGEIKIGLYIAGKQIK